jgi:hypothetical protein
MARILSQCGSRRRLTTLLLLALGIVALVAALLVGIADNPPGLALLYAAVTLFLLALVHHWRTVRRFLVLLIASLLGFPVTAILHNLFYALAELAAELEGLAQVLGFLEVLFFMIAVVVCPPGIVVGAVGAVVLGIRHLLQARRCQ